MHLRRRAVIRGGWTTLKVCLSGGLGALYLPAAVFAEGVPLWKRAAMAATALLLLALAYWSIAFPIRRVRRIRQAGHDHRRWSGRGVD